VQRFQAAIENILKTVPLIKGFTDSREVPVLFSGGVDSMMVALSIDHVLRQSFEDGDGPYSRWKILLFNVAFGEKDEVGSGDWGSEIKTCWKFFIPKLLFSNLNSNFKGL
jgi:asparagine synthetase B (glutamine-hydrolysing)